MAHAHVYSLNRYLADRLDEYDWHVYESGAYGGSTDWPNPSLANEILPMFREGWATGPGQHTREIFNRLDPAFRLASRLLNEDGPLQWFTQLTFGERRRHPTKPGETYIVPTLYTKTPEALAKVKLNLKNLGRVITLMFVPRDKVDDSYGETFAEAGHVPFIHRFRIRDFPTIDPAHRSLGHAVPVIALRQAYQDYFRHTYARLSRTECYRALLAFKITLVHEIAHAY